MSDSTGDRMPVSPVDLRAAAASEEEREEAMGHFPTNWPAARGAATGDPALACHDALALG